MNDAALVFCLGIRSSYRFPDAGQSVCAQDQDVLYAAIPQLIQHRQPVFGAFIFAHLNGQHFLPALAVDSQNDVGCQLSNYIGISNRVVNGIDEHHWIDFAQGPLLPFFDLWKKLVRYIRDEALGRFKYVENCRFFMYNSIIITIASRRCNYGTCNAH